MPTALVTGASAGLGLAVADALTRDRWTLIIDARQGDPLAAAAAELAVLAGPPRDPITAIAGDVTDPDHRARLADAVARAGGLDLLVNNASTLGPIPLRPVHALAADELRGILEVNLLAPFELVRTLLPALRAAAGVVISISSDAAVEHYPDWGGYGLSKAALDHLTLTMAAEHPEIAWYAVDPGDMRTQMQQAAFPGDDISDRRDPADVAPGLLDLIRRRPRSGRYRIDAGGVAVADRALAGAGT